MIRKREIATIRYDEGCLAAHALNLIGDRWALLVVRELMFDAKRFQMIRSGIPGVTASVLTARLAQLASSGVLVHDAVRGDYALTDAGRELLPVLESLCRWALLIPGHDPKRFISPSALMISMGANLKRDEAQGCNALAGFSFGNEAFEIRLRHGRVRTTAVAQPNASFVLSGSGNTLAAAVYGTASLPRLVAGRLIHVEGNIEAAQAFVDLFTLHPHG